MSDVNTFVQEYEIQTRAQDRRPLTEQADPLALSWAAYHVWTKFPNRRWVAWSELEVHDHDRHMANETRRYYRNKLALRALKATVEPTQFSRDLYDICNAGIMRECHKGMLYRLPYFYIEDTLRSTLIDATHSQPCVADATPDFITQRHCKKLRKHSRIFHSRRNREVMEYWFHDTVLGHPVMLSVDYANPLRSMVEHVWKSHPSLSLSGHWLLGHDRQNDFHFWKIVQPELRFD